ncbi:MAG: methylmalonyl Co-A mutase-associated GTPase MeaB [Chloroflexota bacterium]
MSRNTGASETMEVALAKRVLAGEVAAAARLISQVENEAPEAGRALEIIYPHTGKAQVIGITGPPGAGKSSLTDNLIRAFRQEELTVGVVAIDPSSAFTGGAILGDRIRMQKHCVDSGVFIRSLATRGWVGGLAKAAIGTVHVMAALGKDVIIVETVGSGQVEIDITRAADTTLVVLTPGAGDEIQMMKAGILEAADIFVVNKADREGAEHVRADLEVMLAMRTYHRNEWKPGIVLTEAISDKGTGELVAEIRRHREFLVSSGELEKRQRERAKLELLETMEGFLHDFVHRIDAGDYLKKLVDEMLQGKTSPHAAARAITRRLVREMGDSQQAE